jgi:hypothetical protein
MNLKIIQILVLVVLITTIPIAQGLDLSKLERDRSELTFGKTFIRGMVVLPRISNDGKINFYALRLAYKTVNIEGLTYGTIKFQHVQIPRNFNGYFGRFFIYGSFYGKLTI